jgi:hypothetical protein
MQNLATGLREDVLLWFRDKHPELLPEDHR